MSTTTTSLSDLLPSSIPKLDSTGLNWAIFSAHFQDAVEAKGFWGHFDGSSIRPIAISVTAPDGTITVDTTAVDQWDKDERSAKSLLTQKIPDSTLMRVYAKQTVLERWDAIVAEYTEKGAYAQTELRTKFLESKYSTKISVREFLDGLRVEREKLASVGVDIDEKDYRSTIISSLPISLANFASSQLASARLYASTKTIAPDSLISLIAEESKRQKAQRSCWQGKSQDDDKDEAMSVTPGSSKGKGKKGEKKPHGVCWGCGAKDHYKDSEKCPKNEKKGKGDSAKGKGDSAKGKGSANAAAESDSESDEAFAMEADLESVSSGLESDVEEVGDLDENDWFSEMEEEGTDEEGSVYAVESNPGNSPFQAEVYDSGCTNSISPYRDAFENFKEIPPRPFRAANKQSFSATGIGKMTIDVPNGAEMSKLQLVEVLYSPEVGYTLISVGNLDDKGFVVTFGGGKCTIAGPDGKRVGEIPKNRKGLYRVEHDYGSADAMVEELTLDQFHRRMGHISPETARKLVQKGFVTGVRLETTASGDPFFCESCVYAKSTRKPVQKVRSGER